MPRHQVVRRLAARFPTVWIEPADNWREYLAPGGRRLLQRDRWCTPEPGLDVYTPGWRHPLLHRPVALSRATFRSRLEAARRRLLERGATRIVLYIWRDEFAAAVDLVAHDASCYHIDDEYSFSETETPNSPRELSLMRSVDQVIVHSPALFAKKGKVNPHTALIPNGVDFQSFASPRAEPPDLAPVPHPRVGYVGVIKKQLDLALLVRLARARPGYSFVMVGPVMNVSGKQAQLAELQALPNVRFLGEKAPADLPAYMQHLDVCLMCYEANDYTRYIYPLKMHEYLASGRPVVSTPIDAVLPHAAYVALATGDAQWLNAIDAGLAAPASDIAGMKERQDHARAHDWDALVDRVAALFEESLVRSTRPGVSTARNA
jgi:glycosyltransferase involved in cell wall biosynthesis